MTLERESGAGTAKERESGSFTLNIVFREITDEEDAGKYWVAECLEIPGCISQGESREEAERNVEDAMRLCLSVMFEDCMKAVAANHRMPNLLGISSQKRLSVNPTPQLQDLCA